MGILDGYQFDPATYGGGAPPGWLGLLLGAGTPPLDTPAPQSFPPSAPQPPQLPTMSASAGYGAGVDAPPQNGPATLPANSAPTQGQGNPLGSFLSGLFSPSSAQAAPASQNAPAAPQGPGVLDRLSAGASNFTTGGNPIAGIINSIRGLTTGQRTDPAGIQQQMVLSTYHALVGAGIPPAVAQAAALNPEVMKTIAPQLYSKPEYHTIKNALGEDIPIFSNADKQTITYPAANGSADGGNPGATPGMLQQSFDRITAARDSGVPQEQLIQMVPNSLQEPVSAVLQGKALPSNYSMRGQARDTMLKYAHAIDQNFDETTIPMRTTFAHGMAQTTPNSNGGQKLLLNTALQHLASWADHYVALNNRGAGIASGIPGSELAASTFNAIGNSATQNSEHVNAVNDFATKVAGETGKLYSGQSGGGEREREETHARLGPNQSPQSASGALEATREAILGKLNSLQNQRDQAYGNAGENIYPLVDPQTKVALDKIDKAIATLRGSAAPAPQQQQSTPQVQEGATATNPKTGARIVFKGGQWQPIQ